MLDVIREPINIDEIEKRMLDLTQVECPVIHTFGPGLYIRELFMPAGAIAIGHHQRFNHMNIFLKGKVLMLNDDGSKVMLSAPMTFTGGPGRKIGYVIEDVTWLNIYPTNETDVGVLEDTYLEKSDAWKDKQVDRISGEDNEDYKRLLVELGITEQKARDQTENEEDQMPMPYGSFKVGVYKSGIDGRGVFATANIGVGELIAPARIRGKRTPVGRYTNHSMNPNAKMISIGGDIYLISTMEILGCEGGQAGEEVTTDYRDNLNLLGVKPCQE